MEPIKRNDTGAAVEDVQQRLVRIGYLSEDAVTGIFDDATARALAEGTTVYYTGHCTGDWAFAQLQKTLGDRLRPMNGGTAAEL